MKLMTGRDSFSMRTLFAALGSAMFAFPSWSLGAQSTADSLRSTSWTLETARSLSGGFFLLRENSQTWIPMTQAKVSSETAIATRDQTVFAKDPSGEVWVISEHSKGELKDLEKKPWIQHPLFKSGEHRVDNLKVHPGQWLKFRSPLPFARYQIEVFDEWTDQVPIQDWQVHEDQIHLSRLPTGTAHVRITPVLFDQQQVSFQSLKTTLIIPKLDQLQLDHNVPLQFEKTELFIQLTASDLERIRDTDLTLTHSESLSLRPKPIHSHLKESGRALQTPVVLQISRDPSFLETTNLKFQSADEISLSRLPLGLSLLRLRRVQPDGTLGDPGPYTQVQVLLPALKVSAKLERNRAKDRLGHSLTLEPSSGRKWIPAFEYSLSSADGTQQKTIRTTSQTRWVAAPLAKNFSVAVYGIDQSGIRLTPPTRIQLVSPEPLKTVALNRPRLDAAGYASRSNRTRSQAQDFDLAQPIEKSGIEIQWPKEDAVVIGLGTARVFGKVQWVSTETLQKNESFKVVVATDGDLLNRVQETTTRKLFLPLEGNLPEGALFIQIEKISDAARKPSNSVDPSKGPSAHGSRSKVRRFELVYE